MDSEVVEVLKEIRDEVKATNSRLDQTNSRLDQTNSRLDQTNVRLESVEGRLQFVEKRLTNGFAELSQKIETVAARQTEAEIRVATELVAVAGVLHEVRAAIVEKLDNYKMVLDHENRINVLEKRRS